MAKRTVTLTATDDRGSKVKVSATISYPNGRLMTNELAHAKAVFAERLASAVKDVPYSDFGVLSIHVA